MLSLGFKSGPPGVELIGVALVLRWCINFGFLGVLVFLVFQRMPSALDVASATSVCQADLAWESGLCYLGERSSNVCSRRRLVGIDASSLPSHIILFVLSLRLSILG